MVKRLIQPTICPRCGSEMQEVGATTFDPIVEKGVVIRGLAQAMKARETTVAACSGCEFLVDLRRSDGVPKTSAELLSEVGRELADG